MLHVCCGYSLEVPEGGTSNEYPQHTFLWRNKKNISLIPHLSGAMVNGRFCMYYKITVHENYTCKNTPSVTCYNPFVAHIVHF